MIYEALANETVVLSNDFGCISEQIPKESVCPNPDIFAEWAGEIIVEYLQGKAMQDHASFYYSNMKPKSFTFNNLKNAINDKVRS